MSKYSKEQNQDWIDLCTYVKDNILNYSSDMKFPKYLALRLKGLSEGNFIANKNIKSNAKYPFKTILLTCKLVKPKIQNYFINNNIKIKDEYHKINLVMYFIEQEINDVVLRLQQKQKNDEIIEDINMPDYKETTYKTTLHRNRESLKKLW